MGRIYSFQESRFFAFVIGRGYFKTIAKFKLYMVGKLVCRLRTWNLDKGKPSQTHCEQMYLSVSWWNRVFENYLTSYKINKYLLNCLVHRYDDICYNPKCVLIWYLLSEHFFFNFKLIFWVKPSLKGKSFLLLHLVHLS